MQYFKTDPLGAYEMSKRSAKITFAIMERMKRHGVQQAVTNDYNPPGLDD